MEPGRDIWYHQVYDKVSDVCEATPMDAEDPLFILYTSGSTGKPKGVLHTTCGYQVYASLTHEYVFDVRADEVFWCTADVGWITGHSYIVYGPLFKGCTTVLYEGKPVRTPDAGAFWRVLSEHKVKSFFVAPTAFRAVKKEDPDCLLKAKYDLSHLQYQFVAGERLDPPTYHWLKKHLPGVPVIDHWWQTETGWSICTNMVGVELLETKAGSPTLPAPGYDLRILDESGQELGANSEGAIVVKEPLPPGAFPTIWQDHDRYVDSYWSAFPGFYLTGDGGYRDEEGYLYVMGRMDDVINVAGHRLSTGQIEEIVAEHAAVAECAVIGVHDPDKGQVPIGLVVLKDGTNVTAAALQSDLIQMVRDNVGAIANFKRAVIVARLPKTRSGKILRQVMRKMADGETYSVPSTIEDVAVIDELRTLFDAQGVSAS